MFCCGIVFATVGVSFTAVTNTFTVKGLLDSIPDASLATIVNAGNEPFAFALGLQYAVFAPSIVRFELTCQSLTPIFNVPDVTDLTTNAFTVLFVEFELVSALSLSYDMATFDASSKTISKIIGFSIDVNVGAITGITCNSTIFSLLIAP